MADSDEGTNSQSQQQSDSDPTSKDSQHVRQLAEVANQSRHSPTGGPTGGAALAAAAAGAEAQGAGVVQEVLHAPYSHLLWCDAAVTCSTVVVPHY